MSWWRGKVEDWRAGTRRSQVWALTGLIAVVLGSWVVALVDYRLFPMSGFFLWLLVGMLLLRYQPLVVLSLLILVCGVSARLLQDQVTGLGNVPTVLFVVGIALVVYNASRQRSGLPTPLSEALLADLRDRLDQQGRIPALPDGWTAQTAMVAAYGVGYAGDFMVADLDEETGRLDVVLVDVVGKGMAAAPSSLLFAGALGGLLGALPGPRLLDAANEFLLRQHQDETFATAVHLEVQLATGDYTILSAGHPPALVWSGADRRWARDPSRGLALGVLPHPEVHASCGRLEPGDALLFYTDGVVEARGEDIDTGIEWLHRTATTALERGFDGAARRIVREVPRGDDDRAVLLLGRTGARVVRRGRTAAG